MNRNYMRIRNRILRKINSWHGAAICGGIIGLAAGILITILCARSVIADEREKFLADKGNVTEQTENPEDELTKVNATADDSEASPQESDTQDWRLILVNEDHPLDASYEPESLTSVSETCQVDGRIYEDLQKMMEDGEAQGLSMYVTSAYRAYDRQVEIFNQSMQERMNQGMTPLEAYQETSIQVAMPGTSEHATGLAVDIISTEYDELDERQGDTDEQKWLMEHCQEYGFILRYPSDKSDITGIIYEPWHYRYVGKEAAEEIMEQGLTLEEYLLS